MKHDVARRLLGAGERAAEHDRVAAEEERLRDAAVAPDAAIGDERHAAVDSRRQRTSASTWGMPKFVVMPRRAAASRADADLDGVRAALEQEPRALGGRDVAGDDVDVVDALANLGEGALHDQRVAVRDVDHEHVCAGAHTSAARSR